MINVQRLTGWISHRFSPLAGGVGAVSQPWIGTGEPFWIADAHRGDGKRLVVHANQKLTAFLELEAAIRAGNELP